MPEPKIPIPTGKKGKRVDRDGWLRGSDPAAVVPFVVPEEEEAFRPTRPQLRAKTAYWLLVRDDPKIRVGDMTPEAVATAVRDKRVLQWWDDADFRAWFLDQHEEFKKIEYLNHLAIDEAIRRLSTMQDRELLALLKYTAEVGRKLPDKWNAKRAETGSEFAEMTEAELREYLSKTVKDLDVAGEK